ncbi:MAG: PDZ domain-containing protein [Polyangiales bacterium]
MSLGSGVMALLVLIAAGCTSRVDRSLASLKAQQDAAARRLAVLVRDADAAEARRARAEREARASECRAEALRVDAEAAALTSSCAHRHAEVLQCRANIAKAQADSTLYGCLAGIGVGIVTGGSGAPIALLGCAGGRVLGASDDLCGEARCDPAPEVAFRKALAGVHGGKLPMCGGWFGATLEERPTRGARLARVLEGSDAERMGLRVDDVLVSLAGKPMRDAQALVAALAGVKIGDALEAVVARDGHVVHLRGAHAEPTLGVRFGDQVEVPRGQLALAAVAPGSPAARCGLRRGDLLLSLAGGPVHEIEQARRALRLVPAGERVEVGYARGARRDAVTLVLAERAEAHAF